MTDTNVRRTRKIVVLLCSIGLLISLSVWKYYAISKKYDCKNVNPESYPVKKITLEFNQANAFDIYENLRLKIISGTVDFEDLNAFRSVIKDDREFNEIRETLEAFREDNKSRHYKTLYSQFIQASPNSDVLYDYLKNELQNILKKADKNDERRANIYAWPWAYGAQAAIFAYEHTKEQRFLDLVMASYDTILRYRDSEQNRIDTVRKMVLKSWGSNRSWGSKNPPEGIWANSVTYTGRITYPVSVFCKIVFDDKELHPKYLKKANLYLDSIISAIGEFDGEFKEIPNIGEGYYWNPILGKVEPLNHSHAMGNSLVMIYLITGDDKYKEMAKKLGKYFISSVSTEKNGSYVWGYRPTPENKKDDIGELVWKGQITISLPLLLYHYGIMFNENDMHALAKTFMENVYLGNSRFNMYIGADKKRPLCSEKNRGLVSGIGGWILLDRFDPEIRVVIEQAVANRTDIFPGGWFGDIKLTIAYNHRLQSIPREHISKIADKLK